MGLRMNPVPKSENPSIFHSSTAFKRFHHVNFNIVEPFTSPQVQRYLLTEVDRFTRWQKITPMPDGSTSIYARQFRPTEYYVLACLLIFCGTGVQLSLCPNGEFVQPSGIPTNPYSSVVVIRRQSQQISGPPHSNVATFNIKNTHAKSIKTRPICVYWN